MANLNRPRVAIVGATGLVGQTFIKVLEEREFPMESLTLMASRAIRGKTAMPLLVRNTGGH